MAPHSWLNWHANGVRLTYGATTNAGFTRALPASDVPPIGVDAHIDAGPW